MYDVRVSKDELVRVMRYCKEVSDKKAGISILSMVKMGIEFSSGVVEFLSTDLHHGYRGRVYGEVGDDRGDDRGDVAVCVPAKGLYDVVKNFSELDILFKLEGSRLIMRDELSRYVYEIAVGDVSEFPDLPKFDRGNAIKILGKDLKRLIDMTIFACSKDESRHVFSGIYFEFLGKEGKLNGVATDGHRLAVCSIPIEGELSDKEFSFILSQKAAKVIKGMCGDEVMVYFDFIDNYAVIWVENGEFFSRVIEGSFPNYREVIPKSFDSEVKVDRRVLIDALKRSSILITEKFKPVTFTLKGDELILNSQETELGRSQIRIGCSYNGNLSGISFNANYLLDALVNMRSDDVVIRLNNSTSPAEIIGEDDEGFMYLVMPMQI